MNAISRALSVAVVLVVGLQAKYLVAEQAARNGSITGSVLDDTGKPVPSKVMVYVWSIREGQANPGAVCSTMTDSEGHYQCPFLSAGNFIISSTPLVSDPLLEKQPRLGYPVTFYPDVTDPGLAVKIKLHVNEDSSANVILHSVPLHQIRGILPSRPSSPLIALKTHGGYLALSTPFAAHYQAATGQFTFDSVPQGTYEITADWATDSAAHHGTALVALSPAFKQEIRIDDAPLAAVRGRLHYASSPAPRLPTSIRMTSSDPSKQPYKTTINEDGSFTLPSVLEGTYEVIVPDAEGVFVRSVTVAGRDVPTRRILIGTGQGVGTVDIELGKSTATVSGAVDVRQVIAGKTGVVIQPVDDGQVKVAVADAQRRFSLQNLPPGNYRLFAWDDLDDVEYRNPQYLKSFLNKSISLTVDENAQVADVDLRAIEAEK